MDEIILVAHMNDKVEKEIPVPSKAMGEKEEVVNPIALYAGGAQDAGGGGAGSGGGWRTRRRSQ